MAKFLFTVWPFPTHLQPALAVARVLRDRGHQTAFYTGGSQAGVVQADGHRMFPFRGVDEATVESLVLDGLAASARRPWRWAAAWGEWLVGTCPGQIADLDEVLDTWEPDAIVCDMAMCAPFLVLHETRSMPVGILSHVAGCLLSEDGSGIASHVVGGRRWAAAAVRWGADLMSSGVTREANRLRSDFGLGPLSRTITEHAGTMPLYLVPSSAELDGVSRPLSSRLHYVGRCAKKEDGRAGGMAQSRGSRSGRTICVAPGFLPGWSDRLFRSLLVTLAVLPARIVVAQPPITRREIPPELAGRLTVLGDVDAALAEADALVTSGESADVLAAVAAGVPSVVVPVRWDQPMNARHVARAGIGVRVRPWTCTPTRLRRALERVLSDVAMRDSARRHARVLAGCGGASRAAQLIETLAQPVERPLSLVHA